MEKVQHIELAFLAAIHLPKIYFDRKVEGQQGRGHPAQQIPQLGCSH